MNIELCLAVPYRSLMIANARSRANELSTAVASLGELPPVFTSSGKVVTEKGTALMDTRPIELMRALRQVKAEAMSLRVSPLVLSSSSWPQAEGIVQAALATEVSSPCIGS